MRRLEIWQNNVSIENYEVSIFIEEEKEQAAKTKIGVSRKFILNIMILSFEFILLRLLIRCEIWW